MTQAKKLPIILRPANAEDVSFIFNAWLKSFQRSFFAKEISKEIFFSEHHKVIEALLKNYEVIIAANKDDLNQIYGFICAGYTENIFTLHYIYVKHVFRSMGIGTELLNAFNHDSEFASIYTHENALSKRLAKKYNFYYHPYVGLNPDAYIQSKITNETN